MSDDHKIEFTCYERMAGSPEEAQELAELTAKLASDEDVKRYAEAHNGASYQQPHSRGYTVRSNVLPELHGMPLDNLALAFIHSLRPSSIRVSKDGCVCCDAQAWRVTVFLKTGYVPAPAGSDAPASAQFKPLIDRIDQEVEVGYGCGADVEKIFYCRKTGETPKPSGGVYGNAAALARCDFS